MTKKRSHYLLLFLSFLMLFSTATISKARGQLLNHDLVSLSPQAQQSGTYIKAKTSFKSALNRVEKTYDVVFLYEGSLLNDIKVSQKIEKQDLGTLLQKLFEDTNLTYEQISAQTYGVVEKKSTQTKPGYAFAVNGKVTDASDGSTLPGVNILVKGTDIGTATDLNGQYSIDVPAATDTLVFSYVGYKNQIIPVNGRAVINVQLTVGSIQGQELVVVGYGTQQSQDVNGSISTVKAEDIENTPQVSVDQLLQGKAAGVTVTQNSGQPGSSVSVRIRGITSITGNNEPLYVIDGVPVSGDANNTSTSGQSAVANINGNGANTVSPLAGLNPDDIETINILKDASATAIYGSRGANGVVIITTKKGHHDQSTISYKGYVSLQTPMKLLDVLDLPAYARLENRLATAYDVEQREEFSNPSLLGPGTDWQNAIFRDAAQQNHQLSFSGGNNNTTYYISGSYTNQDGIVIGSNFRRYTVRTNVDSQVKDWLKAGISLTGSTSNEDITLNNNSNGAVSLGLLQAPDVAVYNPDGSFAGPPDEPGAVEGNINPVAQALDITNNLLRNKALGNVYAELDLTKDLSFRSSFGGNYEANKNNEFKPTYQYGRFVNETASLYNSRQNYNFWVVKNYFTYKHNFLDKHDVTFLLGQQAQKSSWEGISSTVNGFVSNDIKTLKLGDQSTATDNAFKGESTLRSYYGRLLYSFENKYGLTATFRADESSKFSESHKWGYFPSLAASWKVYQEPFMQGIDEYVDELTFKAGYGLTGNQDIGNYLYSSSLSPVSTGVGTGFRVLNISNPDLQWEEQRQLNLGVSFSLFDSRLSANVEVYNKISDKFLYQLPLPIYLTGPQGDDSYLGSINPPFVNLGKLQNKGIDITLNFNTITNTDFSWKSSLTVSHYKNKVKDLYSDQFNITRSITNGFITSPLTRTQVGKPVGLYYGYKVKGIFNDESTIMDQPQQFGTPFDSTDTWLGDIQYVDVNEDGVINEQDRTYIGDPHPDFTYGFTNTFNYKNLELSVFLQGSYGNKILNLLKQQTTGIDRLYNNQLAEVSDFWTPENTDTDIPRPKRGDDNSNLFISDRYVEDGSYLRIKNLKLGYTLPQEISEKAKIARLKIYGSVQNLYTFTKYSGYDPEVGAFNQDALELGVDNGRYPTPRIFTIGLNVDF